MKYFQSISPGYVHTEFAAVAGFVSDPSVTFEGYPYILGNGKFLMNFRHQFNLIFTDVSQAIMYLLSTPYNVNITELTIRPVGEKF